VALTRAARRDVDLIRIDCAPTLLLWEIAKQGIVLHQSTDAESTRFKAEAAAEYIDFAQLRVKTFSSRVGANATPRESLGNSGPLVEKSASAMLL
jgi:hypothetical protein